jgi:hypothetical protein
MGGKTKGASPIGVCFGVRPPLVRGLTLAARPGVSPLHPPGSDPTAIWGLTSPHTGVRPPHSPRSALSTRRGLTPTRPVSAPPHSSGVRPLTCPGSDPTPHTVNRLRIRPVKKRSGGSGSHRRAKPEEAGARGSRVKKGFLGGKRTVLFGTQALPLLNLLTVRGPPVSKRIGGGPRVPLVYSLNNRSS